MSLPREDSHDAYEALRHPGYRRYLLATQAMHMANQVAKIAIGWTLYDRSGSAWTLAWAALANYLPIFLFSLPAGLWADHPRRQDFLRVTLAGQLLALLGLAWAVHVNVPFPIWYLLIFLGGIARAVHTPLAVTFYPTLLPAKAVGNSVNWNSINFQVSAIAGPILGGYLVHLLGPSEAFVVAAAGSALYLLVLSFLRPVRTLASHGNSEGLRQRILGGWHYLQKDPIIRWALTLDLVAVLFSGAEGILPIFVKDRLQAGVMGPVFLGWLQAATFVGALCMTLWVAHRPLKKAGWAMLSAVAGFAACMIVFSLSTVFWLSFAALFLSGVMDAVSVAVRQTLVQTHTPEHLRGRVQAMSFLFIGSSNELGEFESSITAGWWGPVASVLVGAVATIGFVAYVVRSAPELRKLGTLQKKF
jgi:MFS family permease